MRAPQLALAPNRRCRHDSNSLAREGGCPFPTEAGHALHVWGGVFVCQGVASGPWVVAENLQMHRQVHTLIACGINVGLDYWLIAAYGLMGAVVVTVACQAWATTLGFAAHRQTRAAHWMLLKAFSVPFRFVLRRGQTSKPSGCDGPAGDEKEVR